ncbi:hypothetical protein [Edaphocola aurantiacus]|uniref:hypothetical protein n=1 Tax=Edaphocola aurantiacus TaxID=2601682 RepID=UPI001C965028|nr:hypothetical protein [Edaphocola aurantiacus]
MKHIIIALLSLCCLSSCELQPSKRKYIVTVSQLSYQAPTVIYCDSFHIGYNRVTVLIDSVFLPVNGTIHTIQLNSNYKPQ